MNERDGHGHRLQDWLDAMKAEDRDAAMSALRWDTVMTDVDGAAAAAAAARARARAQGGTPSTPS